MKKLGKLKLNQISKNQLEDKKMDLLKGGGTCTCSCSCECSYKCSCSPYPPGGIANSMTTSNSMSEFSHNSTGQTLSYGNVSVPQMVGY